MKSERTVTRGVPYPFGAHRVDSGVNFAIFAHDKIAATLVVFERGEERPATEIALDESHRTGDIWHAFVPGLPEQSQYVWRFRDASGQQTEDLVDPWSRRIAGGETWGDTNRRYRSVVVAAPTSLPAHDRPQHDLRDLVIYELHVRGYTRHASAQVKHQGTYLGLTEKIPYLVDLGVNAVELLPVAEGIVRE